MADQALDSSGLLRDREDLHVNAALASARIVRTARHTTYLREAGPEDGQPIIFIHGWPEIGLAWRHQLEALSRLGFRAIAPDLRGCGKSAVHEGHSDYAQSELVRDMIELADALKIDRAVWVGHDWGSAVAWNIARHHPERCHGVASLCVPFDTLERGLATRISLVNRRKYPEAEFPAGQFEYIAYYHEHFEEATRVFDQNVQGMLKVIMRRGDPAQADGPYPTAFVRKRGGWFGPGLAPPDVPLDTAIMTDAVLSEYVRSYQTTGFFGVNSLYMNDADNDDYAAAARSDTISMPSLFLSGRHDYVADAENSELTQPMRAKCKDLTYRVLPAGHWMQQERPTQVSAHLCQWIASRLSDAWPVR